ncbi:hypothetical protein Tco_0945766, partial [Tanacetum coccineum]
TSACFVVLWFQNQYTLVRMEYDKVNLLEELISLRVLLQSRHGRCYTQLKLNLLGRTLIYEFWHSLLDADGNTTKATTKGFAATASFLSLDSDEVVGSEEIGPNWCEENVRQYKKRMLGEDICGLFITVEDAFHVALPFCYSMLILWYVRMLQHDELRIETLGF